MTRPGSRLLFILLAIGAVAGCTTNTHAKAVKHLALGDAALARHDINTAVLEYRIASITDPPFGEAHLKLADADVQNHDLKAAFPEYVRAADLLPDRADVQIKAGNLLLLAGHFLDARTRARAVLLKDQKNAAAMILLGNSLAGLKDLDDAIEVGRKAAELDPSRGGTYRNLGVLELAKGNSGVAEDAFKKAVALDPNSISACLALAQFYRSTNRAADAEPWLKRAVQIDPKDLRANEQLGAFYMQTNRASDAEPYLKMVASESRDVDSQLGLVDFYLAAGRVDEARRNLLALAAKPESWSVATVRLAIVDSTTGHLQTAIGELDSVLAKEPQNVSALTVRARLLLAARRNQDALAAAEAAVAADPKSADAAVMLGRVDLALNRANAARQAFIDALANDPYSSEAQIALSTLALASGEIQASVDYAEKSVKADPGELRARLALVRALIAQPESRPRAQAEIKQLTVMFPKSAQISDAAASLALVNQDLASARKAWQRALDLDSNDTDAMSGLAGLLIAAKNVNAAEQLVEQHLGPSPAQTGALLVAAKVRLAGQDPAKAEAFLKQAIARDPGRLEAFALLGQLYVSQKRIGEATQQFGELAHSQPNSASVLTMLGLLSEADHDEDAAIGWYSKAVQASPHAAAAANNLAWIYVSRDQNLDVAMQLAGMASGEQPGEPEFSDTLGWVYTQKQLFSLAIRTLQRSVDADPQNPVHLYHLGVAYADAGDDPSARKALQAALKISAEFDGADQARKVLATLLY
ncbi:MAG TPA: tetratricopeptide repeat protein [Vicinamibacterales bacterium]|jgi:tetratricopeptide (TPR) repeat protein